MAKIRPVLADPTLRAGSVGPSADASAFGSAAASRLGDLAQGLDSAASGVSTYARTLQQIDNHLKDVNDTIAFNEAKVRIQEASTNYLSKPENQASDTYHTGYRKFMDEQLEANRSGVSKEAGIQIHNAWGSVLASGYAHASQTVVARQLETAGAAIRDGLNADLNSVISGSNSINFDLENVGGTIDFQVGSTEWNAAAASAALNKAFAQSDKVYGSLAPNRNQAFKEQSVQNAVLRLVERDPAAARTLLYDHAKYVDGRSMNALEQTIDRVQEQKRQSGVASFTDFTEQTLFSAYSGKAPSKAVIDSALSKQRFKDTYGASGEARYEAFRSEFDAAAEAHETFSAIKDLNPSAQGDFAKEYIDKNSGDRHKARAVQMFRSMVEDNQAILNKDAAHWLATNNSAVASALTESQAEGLSQEQRTAATQTYLDRLIQYQGQAPEGADYLEASRYLGRSRPSILTKNQIADWTKRFGDASTDQFTQLVNTAASIYPTTEKLNYFLSDLMTVKTEPGVDLRFQVFLQNRSNPALASIIESTRESTEDKKLDGAFATDLGKAMVQIADPQLITARQGLGESRVGSVTAMRDVIQDYARRLVLRSNLTPTKAVTQAYDQVFNFSLHQSTVNGSPTLFPKEVDGVKYSDEKINDLPIAAERALNLFDAGQVDLKSFPLVDAALPDDQYKKEEVERIIRNKGRVSVSADGKSMQLLVTDDFGKPFLLRDKKGKPFQVDINEDLAPFADKTVTTETYMPSSTDIGDLTGGGFTPYTTKRVSSATEWRSSRSPVSSLTNWPLRK